jgi:rhamnulokinase
MEYVLAVDIGASSGRHILGHLENGRLILEEVYRFENGMEKKNGHLCWNTARLFSEIKAGLAKCREAGKIPSSMGIDTWAVDYVLLDEKNAVLGETYGYRDSRTAGMDEEVFRIIPETELYARTGIQKQPFNTIYQLMSDKVRHPEILAEAKTMLMIPDYFHFLLTGVKKSEYTNASTTQLVSVKTGDWDHELIGRLGFPDGIFLPLSMPGTEVGMLKKEIADEVGFTCRVVLPATHDTGSAVMAVPSQSDDTLYISSGTWSLMGVETKKAIVNETGRRANFTNEGGYGRRTRFLRNIMGLWMIQSVRHELGDAYSFAQLCEMAEAEKDFPSRVDVNGSAFLAPACMQEAIRNYCAGRGEALPETIGQTAAVIYQSLADSYAETVAEIEALTGRHYADIHIVGGGSNAEYLNRLTAERSGRRVLAGPAEATAIGNLLAQLIADGELKDLKDGRRCVSDSFEIKTY